MWTRHCFNGDLPYCPNHDDRCTTGTNRCGRPEGPICPFPQSLSGKLLGDFHQNRHNFRNNQFEWNNDRILLFDCKSTLLSLSGDKHCLELPASSLSVYPYILLLCFASVWIALKQLLLCIFKKCESHIWLVSTTDFVGEEAAAHAPETIIDHLNRHWV